MEPSFPLGWSLSPWTDPDRPDNCHGPGDQSPPPRHPTASSDPRGLLSSYRLRHSPPPGRDEYANRYRTPLPAPDPFALPDVIVPGWAVALGFGISAGTGVVFGLVPAVKAALLNPIDALRHE